ncbi:helix-turn-helix transcriptional regulator [Planomicrobium okeanokoites]|uniref:helix-turn-helix transcriptional regulator n=1 Tax=Planomicrobium okeanokoites TaxID=244 RepID=UPI00248FBD02|nr:helix-turn-helix transcriptional regulator [Planomicrobium okeanokoites]
MNIGNRIRRTRKLSGLTSGEVCTGIISPSHFSNIENNRFTPAADTLSMIADRLSVPRRYFMSIHDDDFEVTELLNLLNQNIEEENIEGIRHFLHINESKLSYIPSLKQEMHFSLLQFSAFVKLNSIDKAICLYQEKITYFNITTSTVNQEHQQRYYHVSGLYFFFIKNYDKSIYFYKKVLEIPASQLVHAKISFNIALALSKMRKFIEALTFSERAIDFYLRLHDWKRVGNCYNLSAYIAREQKRLDDSEAYIRKGFDILDEKSIALQAMLLHNLALIHKDRGHFAESIDCLNSAIQLKLESGQADLFLSYRVKLDVLLETEDLLEFKKLSDAIEIHCLTAIDQANFYFLLAQYHHLFESYELYEDLMKKTINLLTKEQTNECLVAAADHFSQFYEKNHKYKLALHYQKICTMALRNF